MAVFATNLLNYIYKHAVGLFIQVIAMDRKITAIIAVVLVVIIAAAAAIALTGGDKGEDIPVVEKGPYNLNDITLPLSTRLVVCGNADNNDVIDENDLKMIQDIVDGKTVWDKEKHPLADAYPDGVIDQKDIDLMKNILAKKTCWVYYVDFKNQTVRVQYPITGTIGTMYYQQAQLASMFGLWNDRVIACGSGSLSDISSPGWESRISYGKGYNVDPQTVVSSGVKTILCYTQTDTTAPAMKEMVANTGIDLNVLCVNHEQLLRCVCTYGFLFDLEDISQKYLKLADECSTSIFDSMKNVTTKDQPSVALVMLYGTATTDKIRVLGYNEAGNKHNLATLFNGIPNVNWERADLEKPAYGTYVTSEWFLDKDPDYIVLVGSSMGLSDSMTAAQIQEAYRAKCEEVFGKTSAYKNGNIVCASNGVMNGYSNPLCSMKLLSYVYDQIDDTLADKAYNSWYADYTCFTTDQKPSEKFYRVGA